MSIKQRILTIKLVDKIKRNPDFAKKIGIELKIKEKELLK